MNRVTAHNVQKSIVLLAGNTDKYLMPVNFALEKSGCCPVIVNDFNCIKQLITQAFPDLLIMDDDFSGLKEVVLLLQEHRSSELPIVLMGSTAVLQDQGLENMVDEILGKNASDVEIITRVRSLLETKEMQLKLQKYGDSEEEEHSFQKITSHSNDPPENLKPRILLVEDSKLQSMLMCKNLGTEKYRLFTAHDGSDALETARQTKPDLIILDVILPGMSGFQVCHMLKTYHDTANIPILIITSLESMSDKLKGLDCGADDYLVKPINTRELEVRVNSLLRKKVLHDRLVSNYNQALEKSIRDGLTRLYNHAYFRERLNEEIERARRYKREISVIMIDVDHFKNYNDTNGHPAGDEVLRQLARVLPLGLRKCDLVARYGGEEFVIMLPEAGIKGAQAVAAKINAAVAEYPFKHQEKQPGGNLTVSLGSATFAVDAASADALLENADKALYRAKQLGRNRYEPYSRV